MCLRSWESYCGDPVAERLLVGIPTADDDYHVALAAERDRTVQHGCDRDRTGRFGGQAVLFIADYQSLVPLFLPCSRKEIYRELLPICFLLGSQLFFKFVSLLQDLRITTCGGNVQPSVSDD
jgi:hypothetical protein